MLQLLGWGIFHAIHEGRMTGHYDCHLFTSHQNSEPWLKMGDYLLKLSTNGYALTVRRGNQYGHFIDASSFDGNWDATCQGLKSLGVNSAPYPKSAGTIAAGLLHEFAGQVVALPNEVLQLAWQACKGSRMEGVALGTYQGVAYDINSAFPWAARDFPIAKCKWVESSEFQLEASYGFAHIQTAIPSMIAGPLGMRVKSTYCDETGIVFPVGKLQLAVSKPEMDLLRDMGIPFKILKAIWGYPLMPIYPFQRLMDVLWQLRVYDKPGAKHLSVSCVGQLGSVVEDGKYYQGRAFFNPVYFAHIYADTRCRIYRKALEIGLENIGAFTIDGLITTGGGSATDSLLSEPKDFGSWRKESEGQYCLVNDWFKDRPGEQPRWREALKSTPKGVDQGRFQTDIDSYIGINMAMDRPDLRDRLGGNLRVTELLPLGSAHRTIPQKATRQDYLDGLIETRLG
jgi:hypothetical protein